MDKIRSAVVWLFRWYCDVECRIDRALIRAGWHRRFFSQKGQDRWLVTHVFPGRRNGYFVEVGAGNGITHSNTYLLERDFGWSGVLIEANAEYANELRRTRRALCVIACADADARTVNFIRNGYMSGIVASDTDNAVQMRRDLLRKCADAIEQLTSRRLDDILADVGAPKTIDYMSIDVEGAESRVIRGLSFAQFRVQALTIERPTSEVHQLLLDAGFVLVRCWLWDGFYLSGSLAHDLQVKARPFGGLPRKTF